MSGARRIIIRKIFESFKLILFQLKIKSIVFYPPQPSESSSPPLQYRQRWMCSSTTIGSSAKRTVKLPCEELTAGANTVTKMVRYEPSVTRSRLSVREYGAVIATREVRRTPLFCSVVFYFSTLN